MENHSQELHLEEFEDSTQVEAQVEADSAAVSDAPPPATANEEVEMVRKRLKEIEEEADSLRAQVEKELGGQGQEDPTGASLTQVEKEEVDARSIFVGNVDYECTPEEVQQHFQSCGTVNRVTILNDGFGNPKGFAYVEFVETEAVQNALLLHETELHGRPLKVLPKRTNVPGMKHFRGRRFSRRPFAQGPLLYPSYSYGRVPRSRPPMRYSPY